MWLTLLANNQIWLLDARFVKSIEPFVLASLKSGDKLALPAKNQLKEVQDVFAKPFEVLSDLIDLATSDVWAEGIVIPSTQSSDRQKLDEGVSSAESVPGKGRANGTQMNVAVIPMRGVISKEQAKCDNTPSTKMVISWINAANANPDVNAIVLYTDSPGGSVDGTEELAQVVRDSAKPIVTFVDGLIASAAYWVGSQSSLIYINQETTAWAGSIGVIATLVNQAKALEQEGIQVTLVRDSTSVDKARINSIELPDEAVMVDLLADLDSIKSTFVSYVKKGRGDKLKADDVFSGKVYNGKEAVKKGLVDKVGTLQDAVNAAAKLASKPASSNSKQPNSNSDTMKFNVSKHPTLAKVAQVQDGEAEAEVTEAHLSAVEAHLVSTNAALTEVNAKLKAAEDAAKLAETAKAAAEASLTEANTKVTNLENWKKENEKPGARGEDANNRSGSTIKKVAAHNAAAIEEYEKRKAAKG